MASTSRRRRRQKEQQHFRSQLGFADLAHSRAPRDAVMPRAAGSKYARHSEVGRDRSKATVIIRRIRGKQPPKVWKAAPTNRMLAESALMAAESALMAAAEVDSFRAAAATREQAWRMQMKRWEAWEEEQAKLSCMARERVAATMKKLLGSP